MTLRRTLTLILGLLTTLLMMSAAGLIMATSVQHRSSDTLIQDRETARKARDVGFLLFKYRYYDRLWIVGHTAPEFHARQASEIMLWSTLESLAEDTAGTPRQAELEALRAAVHTFFARLEKAHEDYDTDVDRIYREVTPDFKSIQRRVDRLVDSTLEVAEESRRTVDRVDRLTNIAGVLLLLAGLSLSGFLVRLLWRELYAPALQLRDTVQRYAQGDRSARSQLSSPEELATIAAAFNQLADRQEDNRTAQLRFLSAVAHDLRNPLSSMKMYCGLVSPDRPLPDEARLRQAFQVISRQVDRLNRMTSDLLDATRIEAGDLAMHFESIDVAEISREVLQLFEAGSDRHTLVLDAVDDALVLGDPTRLYQVVTNLVSNAIKYSPQGGVVEVRVDRVEDRIALSVRDEGVGIARSELTRIFEPFRRGGTPADNIPGVGLGLSVARRIVDLHGGRIDVASEPGRGSTFSLSLPALPLPHQGKLSHHVH